ncbi:MAG: glycosyltransferase, partial [Rikenellaceae bacterium]
MYEGDYNVTYLNDYIVKMRMGGLSTDPKRMRQKWSEDMRLYRMHGFNPYWTLWCKILSKVPQFISAKF